MPRLKADEIERVYGSEPLCLNCNDFGCEFCEPVVNEPRKNLGQLETMFFTSDDVWSKPR